VSFNYLTRINQEKELITGYKEASYQNEENHFVDEISRYSHNAYTKQCQWSSELKPNSSDIEVKDKLW
jgi:hypothetical protein